MKMVTVGFAQPDVDTLLANVATANPSKTAQITATHAPETNQIDPDHLKYTYAATAAYLPSKERRPSILTYNYAPEHSDTYTAVYIDPATKKGIMSNRGTKPTDTYDLSADLAIVADSNASHSRFKKAIKDYDALVAKGFDISVTGHSLGGAIADHIVKERGATGVGFNAGASVPRSGWDMRNIDKITHYRTRADPISLLNYRNVRLVTGKKGFNPHAMGNFMPALTGG